MKTFSALLILCSIILSSCNKSDAVAVDPPLPECDNSAIVDADLYQNGPADEYFFQSALIDGNCLKMTVRYGGGCEDVVFQLIDSGAIMESFPIQRNIRLSLEDNDNCEALVTQELSFDLTPLQVEGNSKVILNLQGSQDNLTYNY